MHDNKLISKKLFALHVNALPVSNKANWFANWVSTLVEFKSLDEYFVFFVDKVWSLLKFTNGNNVKVTVFVWTNVIVVVEKGFWVILSTLRVVISKLSKLNKYITSGKSEEVPKIFCNELNYS